MCRNVNEVTSHARMLGISLDTYASGSLCFCTATKKAGLLFSATQRVGAQLLTLLLFDFFPYHLIVATDQMGLLSDQRPIVSEARVSSPSWWIRTRRRPCTKAMTSSTISSKRTARDPRRVYVERQGASSRWHLRGPQNYIAR